MPPTYRRGLRRYVSSHNCRVRLPWFHDGPPAHARFRREVLYNLQPPAPWYLVPPIGLMWVGLSLYQSARMLAKHGRHFAKRDGVSLPAQLARVLARTLRRNFSALDFYMSRAHQHPLGDDWNEYIPSPELGLFYEFVHDRATADIIDRKDLFPGFCAEHGLPTVPILRVLDGRDNSSGNGGAEPLPRQDLFSKPLDAYSSKGLDLWTYQPESDTWTADGKSFTEAELLAHLTRLGEGRPHAEARIIQPRLRNHPALSAFSVRALNPARLLTLRPVQGPPVLVMAMLCVCADDGITNMKHFLSAAIDPATGRLGLGVSPDPVFPDSETHPVTKQRITGTVLPQWKEAVDLVLRAHQLAPPLPIIGWDVAFTPDGPCIVEGNTTPGVDFVQLTNGRTLMTPEIVETLLAWLERRPANKASTRA